MALAGCGEPSNDGADSTIGAPDAGGTDLGSLDSAAGDSAAGTDAAGDSGGMADATTDAAADAAADAALDGAPAPALLRLIHMAAGAPDLQVHLDGQEEPLAEDLAYGEATAAVAVRPGTHVLAVSSQNAQVGAGVLADSGEMTLPAGAAVTVLVVTAPESDTGLGLQLLIESSAVPPPGRALVRFVNSSPDLGPVRADLYGDGNRDLALVAPFDASAADGAPVRANETFEVRLWTEDPGARDLGGFVLPPVDAGESMLIIATGWAGRPARDEDGLALWLVGEDHVRGPIRHNPLVWVLNAVPDAAPLDLFRADRELADDVAYGELRGPVEMWPFSYRIELYPHEWGISPEAPPDGTEPVAADEWHELRAGHRYLAVGTGYLGDGADEPFQFLLLRDDFPCDAELARLRVVHAAPAGPELQAWSEPYGTDAAPLDGWLSFGESTPPEGLPVAPGELVVRLATEVDALARMRLVVSSGQRAFVVIGDGAGSAPDSESGEAPPLELFVIDVAADAWQLSLPERLQ